MSEETPDWKRLERDPLGFFELQAGWDRRDLRRAYGRWIKRFKPDTFPDEFRKIRAAFEQLSDQLRFERADGAPQGEPPRREDVASRSRPSSEDPSAPESAGRPERSALVASMAQRGPASVLKELRTDFPEWWVPSYLTLFLDADAAASDRIFEGQLLHALADRPRDPILLNLMRSWLRRPREASAALEIFERLRFLPDMTVAVMATPLLKRLAAAGHGEVLGNELLRLGKSAQLEGRTAFAAVLEDCLLAAAMALDAEQVDEWLDEVALDRHGRFNVDDATVEAASRILRWRRLRWAQAADVLGADSKDREGMVHELEMALMDLATGDQATQLDVLVGLGERIRTSTTEILEELRPHDLAVQALVEALSIFGLPVGDRRSISREERRRGVEAAQGFLEEMNTRTERSVLDRVWTFMPLTAWTAVAIAITLLLSPLTAALQVFGSGSAAAAVLDSPVNQPEGSSGFEMLAALLGFGLTIVLQFFRRHQDEPLWRVTRAIDWAERRISLFLYRKLWRRRLVDFAVLQPWDGQELVSVLTRLQEGDGSTMRDEIAARMAGDPALGLILLGRDLEA